MIDVEKNRGLEEPADAGRLSAGRDRGPARDGILDVATDDLDLLLGGQSCRCRE